MFPDIWKEALVTPLPKPGDSTDPSNRRPISSLLILSKVAEKAIASQIRNHLESNSLISKNQYGFREKHSTQSLLLQLTNKWLKILDNKAGDRYICLTALDIKKAFDSVDHNLLLYKMNKLFDFHKSSVKLMESYITSRHQSVKTNGVISNSMLIKSGVPQGSVLGPLMFIMFVNDLTNTCSCYLFADDYIIEHYGKTPTLSIEKTNHSLLTVAHWYKTNLLKLNTQKTSVMILANKPVNCDELPRVIIEGDAASFTCTMKYLGLHLDTSLNWNTHIIRIKSKIIPLIRKFGHIRHLIDKPIALLYYTSLIRPQLEYASAVLYNMSGTNSNVLEVLQNRCLRILALAEPRTHNVHLRELLRIPALSDRRKYFFLCEMYKLNNNIGPIITHQNQNQLHIVTRNTRSTTASNLYMPRMNKSVGQRSLDYLGPCTFNSLPTHIKKLTSFDMFKKQLRQNLLSCS